MFSNSETETSVRATSSSYFDNNDIDFDSSCPLRPVHKLCVFCWLCFAVVLVFFSLRFLYLPESSFSTDSSHIREYDGWMGGERWNHWPT